MLCLAFSYYYFAITVFKLCLFLSFRVLFCVSLLVFFPLPSSDLEVEISCFATNFSSSIFPSYILSFIVQLSALLLGYLFFFSFTLLFRVNNRALVNFFLFVIFAGVIFINAWIFIAD